MNPNEYPRVAYVPVALLGKEWTDNGGNEGQQNQPPSQPPSQEKNQGTPKQPDMGIQALYKNLFSNLAKKKYHQADGSKLPVNPSTAASFHLPQGPQQQNPPTFQPPQQPALLSPLNPPFGPPTGLFGSPTGFSGSAVAPVAPPTGPFPWPYGPQGSSMTMSSAQFLGAYPPSIPCHTTAPNSLQPQNPGFMDFGHPLFPSFSGWQPQGGGLTPQQYQAGLAPHLGLTPHHQGPGPTLPTMPSFPQPNAAGQGLGSLSQQGQAQDGNYQGAGEEQGGSD
ncbi:uncharacterized protein C8A04DRAFT_31218 [Dichotomopilus funicola]|uniref:Uncharacterized protein n=1 Tax=Dichotomopilus funicola TaxID=1934379 RepID=A0AAN6V0F8_9PEZI|nr:hypothetical protein C8A04DRAFT_31218 [Dichotomopilus funicola]